MMNMRLVIMGLGLAAMTAAAQAAVIVVRSSGPSAKVYPPGRALPDTTAFRLKANDVLVLLDSRGTRTLRGPGNFNATAGSAATTGGIRSAVSAITAQNSDRRARVGAVRGVPTTTATTRNIWQADIAKSGTLCFADPADVALYRDVATAPGSVLVRDLLGGASATVTFAAGARTAFWPRSVPVTAGGRYQLSTAPNAATNVTMRSIAPVPAGLEGLAQSLIRNGCQSQLDVLIDTVAVPSAS